MDVSKEVNIKEVSVEEKLVSLYCELEEEAFEAILKEVWRFTMEQALHDGKLTEAQYKRYKNIEFKEGD